MTNYHEGAGVNPCQSVSFTLGLEVLSRHPNIDNFVRFRNGRWQTIKWDFWAWCGDVDLCPLVMTKFGLLQNEANSVLVQLRFEGEFVGHYDPDLTLEHSTRQFSKQVRKMCREFLEGRSHV